MVQTFKRKLTLVMGEQADTDSHIKSPLTPKGSKARTIELR
ncbi:unnamed protein product [marine sediment metagenome]|uniref:Uncharacterized protein n=1 Tax=marine sediment metagenome TaxID=412755 RepID=X1B303_9ZZZZ